MASATPEVRLERAGEKLLLVGMDWRRIITDQPQKNEIARKAAETGGRFYWSGKDSRSLGFTPKGFRGTREPIYPAMIAFRNLALEDGNKNALLVYQCADDKRLLVLGIVRGEPAPRYDCCVHEDGMGEIFKGFKSQCDTDPEIYTNVSGYGNSRRVFDWARLAAYAKPEDALQTINALQRKLIVWGATAVVVLGTVIGGWTGYKEYRARKEAALEAARKNPQARYDESLAALAPVTPIGMKMASRSLNEFLAGVPMSIGGWQLQQVGKCELPDSVEAQARCRLMYRRPQNSVATNRTFEAERPKTWSPAFEETGKTVLVTVPIPWKVANVAQVKDQLPTGFDTRLYTGSDLQKWSVMIDNARLEMPAIWAAPDGIAVDETTVTGLVKRGRWSWSGPARSVELLAHMPDHFALSGFEIHIKDSEGPAKTISRLRDSVFVLQKIEGYYYVR